MPLPKTNPTSTKAWAELARHFKEIKDQHLRTLFSEDPKRAESFAIEWDGFFVDFSKNRINNQTLELLLQLAEECQLSDSIKQYLEGDIINETENRAVLHTALRATNDSKVLVDGENVIKEIDEVKTKIRSFTEKVINGEVTGHTGKRFTHVVNIGIGGSDLGPVMVTEALGYYKNHLNISFVSNVDGDHVHETLKNLPRETTLFVIVSKSFTTQETLSNAITIREWFLENAPGSAVSSHFIAVSSNVGKVKEFGISEENIFPMWDWVGGRFSLWSAVGISIALALGYDKYEALLDGAREMDDHFANAKYGQNLPVVLALLSIWYNNFFGAESEAVIPYNQYLHRLPAYLQQAVMESNGKGVDRSGNQLDYQSGTIIWGEPGTNSQHAFFQLMHQGTKLIPADFIGFTESQFGDQGHHDKLMANFIAQTEALMQGKTASEAEAELRSQGLSEDKIKELIPFKVFEGNRPTTTFLIDKLTPKRLGSLIAMYEHKIFVQGVIWNIYSYDQWGVELGKQLANTILQDFQSAKIASHDASTTRLIRRFKGL